MKANFMIYQISCGHCKPFTMTARILFFPFDFFNVNPISFYLPFLFLMRFVKQPMPIPIAENPIPINKALKSSSFILSKVTMFKREKVRYSQTIYIIPINAIVPTLVKTLKSSFPIIIEIIKLVIGRIPQNTKIE